MKKIFFFVIFCSYQIIIGQTAETCESPAEESLLDLNTITKCTIEESTSDLTKQKEIKIQVSARKRVIRKKQAVKGINSSTSKSIELGNLNSQSSVKNSLDLDNGDMVHMLENIESANEKVIEKVPFNHVEQIPLLDACKDEALLAQKKCFNDFVADHIKRNLTYPSQAYSKNIQGKVLTQFVIDKEGNITDVNLRGPYQGDLLEEEALRIIKKLPKFIPGSHHGKTVKVKYGIPINFKIPGKKPSNIRTKETLDFSKIISFKSVDQIPTFKNCNDTSETCFNNELIKHVNSNFLYPEKALQNNIQGKVLVYFVIGKSGDIINIRTRAPKGCEILEESTKDLFNKLPRFNPGKHQGKISDVKHVFPIDFKIE